MSTEIRSPKVRKGTRSCTECRRRKVRCIWPSEEAQSCRRCQERGAECVSQTYSISAITGTKKSSRERISQLESKVAQLSKIVHNIEVNIGPRDGSTLESSSLVSDLHNGTVDQELGEEDEGDDSDSVGSQLVVEDRASVMKPLFHNEWVSADSQHSTQVQSDRRRRATTSLLDKARPILQRLIPEVEDVVFVSVQMKVWLPIIRDVFPETPLPQSRDELTSSYDHMKQADCDVWQLTFWLLSLALWSQQIPEGEYSPNVLRKIMLKRNRFARLTANTVERYVLSHDSLLGTVEGLQVSLFFLRTHLTWGHFQKAWLFLHRMITIAELMGFPRVSQLVETRKAMGQPDVKLDTTKAQLWKSICSVERLCGILNNFPMTTRMYVPSEDLPMIINGKVHAPTYLLKLSYIAVKIQAVDEFNTTSKSDAEIYAGVLELDSELRAIASATPKDFWNEQSVSLNTTQLLRFWHYCMLMNVHLRFILRPDHRGEYTYSKQAGIIACKALIQSWQDLRRALPSGFFMCRIVDVLAFKAAVILLLVSHSSRAYKIPGMDADYQHMDTLVQQVMDLLAEKSKEPTGSSFAAKAVMSIFSLMTLLQGNDSGARGSGLTLTVPMLGKVHIRKNDPYKRANAANHQGTAENFQGSSLWQPNQSSEANMGDSNAYGNGIMAQELWDDDLLSWSIESDYEAFFHDNLLAEDYAMMDTWQYDMSDPGSSM